MEWCSTLTFISSKLVYLEGMTCRRNTFVIQSVNRTSYRAVTYILFLSFMRQCLFGSGTTYGLKAGPHGLHILAWNHLLLLGRKTGIRVMRHNKLVRQKYGHTCVFLSPAQVKHSPVPMRLPREVNSSVVASTTMFAVLEFKNRSGEMSPYVVNLFSCH